jgi:hypothetical protein
MDLEKSKAAMTERRIKAIGTVSAVDVGAATRKGWDGKAPESALIDTLEAVAASRQMLDWLCPHPTSAYRVQGRLRLAWCIRERSRDCPAALVDPNCHDLRSYPDAKAFAAQLRVAVG